MDGRDVEPWRKHGCLPVAEVLAAAGLPEDALRRAGLLFDELFSWGTGTLLAHTAKAHVFEYWGNKTLYVVKAGHGSLLLDLLERIRTGQNRVVRYPPHIAAMKARNAQVKAERAARHAERLGVVEAQLPSSQRPLSPVEAAAVARFLESWNAHDPARVLYANGIQDLLDLDLSAQDREGILRKLKPAYFTGRSHSGSDPLSGWWRFERPLYGCGMCVQIIVGLPADDVPYCVYFAALGPVPADLPPHAPLQLAGPSAHHVVLALDGNRIDTWVWAYADAATGTLYTTTEQDRPSVELARNQLRVERGLPFPADLSRFSECWLRHETHHLDMVLGWRVGRWRELERGALATGQEAAELRELEQPQGLFEKLVERFPKRYSMTAPECWDTGMVDLRIRERHSSVIGTEAPDVYSGYVRKDLDWLGEWAYAVAYKMTPTWDEFWPLMFLGDMMHYRMYGHGFTGLRYQATGAGPFPPDAPAIMDRLCGEHILKYKGNAPGQGKSKDRVHPHPFHYPSGLQASWHTDDVRKAITLERGKCDPSNVLRECQRVPAWKAWAEEAAYIPYDVAFDMRM